MAKIDKYQQYQRKKHNIFLFRKLKKNGFCEMKMKVYDFILIDEVPRYNIMKKF